MTIVVFCFACAYRWTVGFLLVFVIVLLVSFSSDMNRFLIFEETLILYLEQQTGK